MIHVKNNLRSLLDDLENGHPADRQTIKTLLNVSEPEDIDLLFNVAQRVRFRYFGTCIFFYGFLYFSTYCRNNCRFCQYRNANTALQRYRKSPEDIITTAKLMAASGVHLIDMTMGEDPEFYASSGPGFDSICEIAAAVAKTCGLPVMLSAGLLPNHIIKELHEKGIAWHACYQETHNRSLYGKLRKGQDFDARITSKAYAKSLGLLIEEGILTGVGEQVDDIVDSILWMQAFGVDQARVMTFVPQQGTPMAHIPPSDGLRELIIIAVMRLVLKDVLIPASLDVGGLDGLRSRLYAGANVVTSIVPPEKGLSGVANPSLDIEESRRSMDHVLPVIKTCGLEPATPSDYVKWIENRKIKIPN